MKTLTFNPGEIGIIISALRELQKMLPEQGQIFPEITTLMHKIDSSDWDF